MRVHHLNCGTMHPRFVPDGLVCHVLLVETPGGLVLVDSGLGLRDAESPGSRFGPARFYVRPVFDPNEAAINQIRRLGFEPRDVRHIVVTHFDADHVGGLADFPWAQVHLTDAEAFAALHPKTLVEKQRYLPAGYSHGPILVEHAPSSAESWRGFPGAKELTEIADGIVLINLPGHTRGHAAVAVDAGDRWVLHVGDSFYHRGQLDGSDTAPRALRLMERSVAFDWTKVQANHQRLSELWAAGEPGLFLVNAHDPQLLWQAAN
ncbi:MULTISPECIES: MBL fold metallo-hydrolase [unclassified Mycobacterium]|uniref:MBL fold metallo-hydrolase n=1 Tax=unclassified Mycobacterium TaxID=2642494 RepID=UPI0004907B04|nr:MULTISPECIES: MBL fold metallo-hydrolase [unclassified Mycobacterium]SEA74944.1 Metallo-beta-lactamase superfamily protein [Mycobacterium sp. 283mftsu]